MTMVPAFHAMLVEGGNMDEDYRAMMTIYTLNVARIGRQSNHRFIYRTYPKSPLIIGRSTCPATLCSQS